MSAIGNVEEMYLITADQLGNQFKTRVGSGLRINSEKTYQEIDTAQRALAGLTTNTYQDTTLITSVSVNDKIAEEIQPG